MNTKLNAQEEEFEMILDAPHWWWWGVSSCGYMSPKDYICGIDTVRPVRQGAVEVLQRCGFPIREILSIFCREYSDKGRGRSIADYSEGMRLDKVLGIRYFSQCDYDIWAKVARIAGRSIWVTQGVSGNHHCESMPVMTVYPTGRFRFSELVTLVQPKKLFPLKTVYTTQELMARLAQLELEEREVTERNADR
ncbi:MAG: hypothetical protein PHS79_02625 [Patescibacteria group bacterium]|nr:hypothetical protein [Patescibacteria group bacterium]